MIQPGNLNRRLVLEAPQEADDGAGGKIRSHVAVTTLWAQVLPLPSRPVAAAAAGATRHFVIVIRARPDVTTQHRFVENDRIYRILSLRESADRSLLRIEADLRED
jgi:SPP1 family predicted phage head-tail adaptor